MSRTLSAPRWGLSAALAGALALALTALAALGLAAQANAAFNTTKCAGPSITGEGGSFAKDAHVVFNFNFKNSYCPGTSSNVTYAPNGSGSGVKAVTLRTLTPRFGQTDDPPTPEQVALMNAGATVDPGANKAVTEADTDPSNNGKIHVVPSAVGAVVALVNLPESCDSKLLLAAHRTDNAASTADDKLLRVRFSKAEFEQVWAQGASGGPSSVPYLDWDEVLTELNTDADCHKPIVRVVRFDQSGSTFTFKDYLNAINPAREWKTKWATTGTNLTREWPGATFGPRTDCAGTPEGPGGGATQDTDNLTSGCGNGNGNLVDKLIATDGSVGYADLATARNKGLAINATTGAEAPTTPYWTQVQNGSGTFSEPTADVNGFRTDGSKGANCLKATFAGIPATPASDPTLGDWSKASGVNSPDKEGTTPYGICTLTYGLVFDDNSAVWGNTPSEEAQARTVKDYWEGVLGDGTQGQLFPADYAPLPAGILALSRTGIAAVDWHKGPGDSVVPPHGDPNPVTPPGGDGGGTTPAKPSNAFSLLRKSISSKTGAGAISVKLPGAGKLDLLGTAKVGKKKIKVGHVVLTASKAGTFELALKPSAAAKKVLREKGSLRVSLELTFTPTGGDAKTSNTALTLKLKKQSKGHH
jgi:ABC-type phosphate transport system substrate-binding protein